MFLTNFNQTKFNIKNRSIFWYNFPLKVYHFLSNTSLSKEIRQYSNTKYSNEASPRPWNCHSSYWHLCQLHVGFARSHGPSSLCRVQSIHMKIVCALRFMASMYVYNSNWMCLCYARGLRSSSWNKRCNILLTLLFI